MNKPERGIQFWRGLTAGAEQLQQYKELLEVYDSRIGSFLEIDPVKGAALIQDRGGSGPLAGMPFGVKDNIAVKNFQLSCGSKILENFISPYTATAVQKLLAAGAIPVGKVNLDEFGMGSSTENSAYHPTVNPWDHAYVPGGSSGGSAAAVAAGLVPFALGSDTGGSVRQPAAFCGTYGLKPTYGAVSRFGLTAYASSLECVGILADSVHTTREVFRTISGADPLDQTSTAAPEEQAATEEQAAPEGQADGQAAAAKSSSYTIGVLKQPEGLDAATETVYLASIERMKDLGWTIVPVDLDTLEYVVSVYYTIATAEASANLARYTGIRYGVREQGTANHEEMVRLTREHGFGNEVKLRILLGTYVLRSGFQDQYYVRAQKIRTLILREITELFTRVDMLLMPVFPVSGFRLGSEQMTPFQQKMADKFTVTANLAGIPSLSFPAGKSGQLPVGMQLMAPVFQEERLFNAAEVLSGGRPIELAPGSLVLPDGYDAKAVR